MKKYSFVLPLALLLAAALQTLSCATFAQNVLWKTLSEGANSAMEKGEYHTAESLLLQLKDMATQGHYEGQYLIRPNLLLSSAYRAQGKYAEAEKLLQETMVLTEQQLGENCEDMVYELDELASIKMAQGKLAEANELLKTSLSIAEKLEPTLPDLLPNVLDMQMRLSIMRGAIKDAEAQVKRALLLLNTPAKQNNMTYIHAVFVNGTVEQLKGNLAESIALYQKSLEKAGVVLGKRHAAYGELLVAASEAYRQDCRFDEALALLSQGLEILQSTLGKASPNLARAKMNLAEVYCDMGQYSKAEAAAKEALEINRQFLGNDAPEIANCHGVISRIYRYQGRYKQAEQPASDCVDLTRKICGSRHFAVGAALLDLGVLYADEGRPEEAESTLKQALTITHESLGADHPDSCEINNALARVYLTQKRYAEAEPLLKQSLEVLVRRLGKQHTLVAADFHDLADLYLSENKLADAERNVREALAIDEKLFGAKSAKVASDLELLSRILTGMNKRDAAREVSDRFESIKKGLPGSQLLARLKATDEFLDTAGSAKPVADKWALVVGISNFKDPTMDLKYAAKDATDFRNFLVNSEHFKPDHVMLLTDAAATREQILSKLGESWLGKLAKKDDLVVVYVSSHGSPSREEVGVNFLVAYDTSKNGLLATGIPMQWLTKIVKEEVHADRTLLILDVCHSAAAAEERTNSSRSGEPASGTVSKDSKDLIYKRGANAVNPESLQLGTGQLVLCSSLADQVSWESRNYANSVFTRKLMDALRCKGDQTTLQDAYKTLRSSVQAEVLRDRGELQTPLLSAKNWTGGDPCISALPALRQSR